MVNHEREKFRLGRTLICLTVDLALKYNPNVELIAQVVTVIMKNDRGTIHCFGTLM